MFKKRNFKFKSYDDFGFMKLALKRRLQANKLLINCLWTYPTQSGPPECSANLRGNPSILIRFQEKNILIDCGKTFREAVLRWLPRNGLRTLDAIVLTHAHADAVMGLDDVRGIQGRAALGEAEDPLPVFATSKTLSEVQRMMPYLFPSHQQAQTVKRMVAKLDFRPLEHEHAPFLAGGLPFQPFAVWHGSDYEALGFIFGREERVAYISDVSAVPEEGFRLMALEPLALLVVDCLFQKKQHETHFSLPAALACVRRVRPARALLTGLSHEFHHERDNLLLRRLLDEEGLDVQLARDGLRVPLRL